MARDSVFVPAFGNRPTSLIGRSQIIEEVVSGLKAKPGSRERATVLLGQRGYGKTVLLWEFADQARQLGYVVANPTSVREGMVARIAEKLWDDGERLSNSTWAPRVSGGNVGALGFTFSFSFDRPSLTSLSPEGRIEKLVRDLTSKGVGTLILVDELQANAAEVRNLVGTYQELVGEGLDVAIVLAGLPSAVSGVLNDHVLTFLNRATKIELPPLSTGEIDIFYRKAFKDCGVSISPELRRHAAESAEGSPYLMQLIGHYVVAYADQDAVDRTLLDEAIGSAAADFKNDVCKTTLAPLSAGDVSYLRAMACLGTPCKTASVAKELNVTADFGQQYRRRLLDAGVIGSPATGIVDFAVPFLGDYLLSQ